jgi:hypothetical protein
MSRLPTARPAGARQREAAQHFFGRLGRLARALDPEQVDRAVAAGDAQGAVQHLTGLARAVRRDPRHQDLDPHGTVLAGHLEPGAGEGRQAADVGVDLGRRAGPVDPGLGGGDLLRIGRLADLFRALDRAALDGRQGPGPEGGADVRHPLAEAGDGIVGTDVEDFGQQDRALVEAL